MLPDLEVLGPSENNTVANLVEELRSDCHKKLNDQKSRKWDSKYTSYPAKIESRRKEIVLAPSLLARCVEGDQEFILTSLTLCFSLYSDIIK